ncbi:AGE family epimerase/isomerase [Isoptericola halotolerans]|uniref:Mannose/cellobiose epimerase-like protein (N-acyl-D-glucosamine 2-epimerase family) n=1 Tax=Isoptericola halotolerans TaxID=300560 RepID=A0ABX1ZZJ0_9MICO|nr:AGE family epimerase/isomerase [Isoptericola halotolerans]NOV96040.1 mannose/cellobiose epimerase-like protein (N-acyl-D-glucosamine 2-epimerase family) [Isoptericola halotolerans]
MPHEASTPRQPDAAWRAEQVRELLEFGAPSVEGSDGATWLDDDGRPDTGQPVHTWITSRMAHTYALGHLLGVPHCGERVDRALAGLTGTLHDHEHGGWFASSGPGDAVDGTKAAYAHAFVVLAASSASQAGRPGAEALLGEALDVLDERFWETESDLLADEWDRPWLELSTYRGINANMHGVEALLAASDATGDARWRDRAARVVDRTAAWAQDNGWRIPEHFTAEWAPDLEFNADRPHDQFKPYGSTPGHGFEWARLLLQLDVASEQVGRRTEAAVNLFDRALSDGFDGTGFVYTVDWSGEPVERRRFHWVAAEAVAAAEVLARVTGSARYAEQAAAWWELVRDRFVDPERGSWHHELDAADQPAGEVWAGKPDIYHAVQALLVPDLPLAGSFAESAGRAGSGAI